MHLPISATKTWRKKIENHIKASVFFFSLSTNYLPQTLGNFGIKTLFERPKLPSFITPQKHIVVIQNSRKILRIWAFKKPSFLAERSNWINRVSKGFVYRHLDGQVAAAVKTYPAVISVQPTDFILSIFSSFTDK